MDTQHLPELIAHRYRLLRKLGAGGMGLVYEAFDRLTGEIVALKLVPDETDEASTIAEGSELRLILIREFQTLARLRHPNIISIRDYGFDDDDQPFFTMELLEGASNLFEAGQNQPLKTQIELLVQLLNALVYLHRRGILHRDLKPGNVLVREGQVKVLDFGAAVHRTENESAAGTIAYMAPEVLTTGAASASGDLYSVGIMAYELLTGGHPYDLNDTAGLIDQVLYSTPDLSKLPKTGLSPTPLVTIDPFDPKDTQNLGANTDELIQIDVDGLPSMGYTEQLDEVIGRLLAKKPEERYQDADTAIRALCAAAGVPLPPETAALRESFLQGSPFVGREQEIAALANALESAAFGAGSGWLISGESGVGKSRLINELRIRASSKGFIILVGQMPSAGGTPYILWREIMRRLAISVELAPLEQGVLKALIPDLESLLEHPIPDPPPVDAGSAQTRLFATIRNGLNRLEKPALIILEDLQWADAGSLDLLNWLRKDVHERPLMIMGSYRSDEAPTLPARLPGMEYLHLERLTTDQIADLSVYMLGEGGREPLLVELLQRETEGNVFFLVEVVRALAEDAGTLEGVHEMTLPSSVFAGGIRRLVERRLRQIPPAIRPFLDLAAVLGRSIDVPALQMAFGGDVVETALQICTDAAVLEVVEDRWRFAHDKLREGVLARLAIPEQTRLHFWAAEVIEAAYDEKLSAHYPALAYHYQEAGDRDSARRYWIMAGDRAAAELANDDALKYYDWALRLTPPEMPHTQYELFLKRVDLMIRRRDPDTVRGALLELQSVADHLTASEKIQGALRWALFYASINDHRAQLEAAERILELHQESGEAEVPITARLMRGEGYMRLNRYQESEQQFQEALRQSQSAGLTRLEARALNELGSVYYETDDLPKALSSYQQALEVAEANGEWMTQCDALNGIAISNPKDYGAAQAAVEKSIQLARKAGDLMRTARGLTNLGSIHGRQGDLVRESVCASESAAIQHLIGNRRGEAIALYNQASIQKDIARFKESHQTFERALSLGQEIGDRDLQAHLYASLAQTCFLAGDQDTALAHAHTLRGLAEALQAPNHAGMSYLVVGLVALERAQWSQATESLHALYQMRKEQPQPNNQCFVALVGWLTALERQGKVEVVQAHLDELVDRAYQTHPQFDPLIPLAFLWTYQLLTAMNDPRTPTLLEAGYKHVQTLAQGISDESMREQFLTRAPGNRELWALGQKPQNPA